MWKHGMVGAVGSLFSILALGVFVGCSGSGTSAVVETSRSSSVSLTIRWPDRTRLIPLAAQSIKIELRDAQGALLGGPSIVPRPASGNLSNVTFIALPAGTISVTATAFPKTDATGVAQATGTVQVTVLVGKTVAAALTMDSTIDHVQLTGSDGTPLPAGQSRTLTAQAFNSAGETILVDPSQWEWSSSDILNFTLVPAGEGAQVTNTGRGHTTLTLREKESGKVATLDLWGGVSLANTRILFVSRRHGSGELYLMNPDGSNQTRLTNNTLEEGFPVISPDGTKIAFTQGSNWHGTDQNIFLMNFDGSGMKQLTFDASENNQPYFTPDGKRIVFYSAKNGNYDIYIVDIDGSNLVRLTNSDAVEKSPAVSPDGAEIIYVRDSSLWKMRIDGTEQKKIVDGDGFSSVWNPAFSPDGKKIAFSRNITSPSYYNYIYVVNSDGMGETKLTTSGSDILPCFSPDSKKIVFTSNRSVGSNDFTSKVYVMDANGDNQTRLTFLHLGESNPQSDDEQASWSGFVF